MAANTREEILSRAGKEIMYRFFESTDDRNEALEQLWCGNVFDWDHRKLFQAAYEKNEAVIESHENKDGFNYLSPLFNFVRGIKAHPDFLNVGPATALRRVETWLREEGMEWENFREIRDESDAVAEFTDAWLKVKYGFGGDPLVEARFYAQNSEVKVTFPASVRITPGYQEFGAALYYLQRLRGDQEIFLPTRRMAHVFDRCNQTISQWKQQAERDGLLTQRKRYDQRVRKADEFRVDLSKFTV